MTTCHSADSLNIVVIGSRIRFIIKQKPYIVPLVQYLFHPYVTVQSDRVPDISPDQTVVHRALLEPRLNPPGSRHRQSSPNNWLAGLNCWYIWSHLILDFIQPHTNTMVVLLCTGKGGDEVKCWCSFSHTNTVVVLLCNGRDEVKCRFMTPWKQISGDGSG